ncbi:MAG: DNA recombination protein RmuC [Bacillus subtilis]|nr:DNA recombination protein RmuC [Bacillus subtilis]
MKRCRAKWSRCRRCWRTTKAAACSANTNSTNCFHSSTATTMRSSKANTRSKKRAGKTESVRADAAVFMPDPIKLIAIDSKFPFSAYRKLFEPELTPEDEKAILSEFLQNVKKHITDIASKYIISGVTAEFALMFVPSDGVLSLIHAKLPSVVELARTKNVTIVSPTTLIPLLSSFKAISIDHLRSRYAIQISQQLHALEKDFASFGDNWTKVRRYRRPFDKELRSAFERRRKDRQKVQSDQRSRYSGDFRQRNKRNRGGLISFLNIRKFRSVLEKYGLHSEPNGCIILLASKII